MQTSTKNTKNTQNTQNAKVRLDKWLWAARFFKTRSIATDAVSGGKVYLSGQRIKPAKEVHVGDQLKIRTGYTERTVIVQTLSMQRRSAKEAVLLYEETAESIEKREELARLHRKDAALRPRGVGRPTKKERRLIHSFTKDSAA